MAGVGLWTHPEYRPRSTMVPGYPTAVLPVRLFKYWRMASADRRISRAAFNGLGCINRNGCSFLVCQFSKLRDGRSYRQPSTRPTWAGGWHTAPVFPGPADAPAFPVLVKGLKEIDQIPSSADHFQLIKVAFLTEFADIFGRNAPAVGGGRPACFSNNDLFARVARQTARNFLV